ncbi:hypothetical protein H311_01459, partial [Anncaliia algerae PRA109]
MENCYLLYVMKTISFIWKFCLLNVQNFKIMHCYNSTAKNSIFAAVLILKQKISKVYIKGKKASEAEIICIFDIKMMAMFEFYDNFEEYGDFFKPSKNIQMKNDIGFFKNFISDEEIDFDFFPSNYGSQLKSLIKFIFDFDQDARFICEFFIIFFQIEYSDTYIKGKDIFFGFKENV